MLGLKSSHFSKAGPGWHIYASWNWAYSGSSHYLNHCWYIIIWSPGNKVQWNLNQDTKVFIQQTAVENVVCTTPLPYPMLTYRRFDRWAQISMKFQSKYKYFLSRKFTWNVVWCQPFCSVSMWQQSEEDTSVRCRCNRQDTATWYQTEATVLRLPLSCFTHFQETNRTYGYCLLMSHAKYTKLGTTMCRSWWTPVPHDDTHR